MVVGRKSIGALTQNIRWALIYCQYSEAPLCEQGGRDEGTWPQASDNDFIVAIEHVCTVRDSDPV